MARHARTRQHQRQRPDDRSVAHRRRRSERARAEWRNRADDGVANRRRRGDAVLLKAGADVNATEKLRGTTALMWAAAQTHPAAVRLLIEHGANVGARSSPAALGRTAYLAPTARQRASQLVSETGGARPRAGRAEKAPQQDLDDRDFFVRRQNNDGGGLTALVLPPRRRSRIGLTLVAAGADVNQVTQCGWTPLLTATQNRHYAAGHLPARTRRRSEPRQQRRLDAALSGHRQPQYRRRRLSGAAGRSRSPRVHQDAARPRRERQRPREGQHRDAQ